jgi:hypothetical protein
VHPSNENAHQLRAIMLAPAQTFASLVALTEGAARAAPRAGPARRLHARVRPRETQSCEASRATASAEVRTGITSNSTRSRHCAIQASSRTRSSHSIT